MDLETVWTAREEHIYPDLFGTFSRGIFPLPVALFERFGRTDPDPRWLTCGVMEYAPSLGRKTWVYVTSGYSNPWEDDPEEYSTSNESGAGVEFVLETIERADWAIRILHYLFAFDLLLVSGHFGKRPALSLHDRVPLHASLDLVTDSPVRNVIAFEPVSFPSSFELASGKVRLMEFVGVTDAERDFAREHGFDALAEKLSAAECFPATVPQRNSTC